MGSVSQGWYAWGLLFSRLCTVSQGVIRYMKHFSGWPGKLDRMADEGPDPWVQIRCRECKELLEAWAPTDYPTDDVLICGGCLALHRVEESVSE